MWALPSNFATVNATGVQQVQAPTKKLVKSVTVVGAAPARLHTPIQLSVESGGIALEKLEFRLWEKYEDQQWEVVTGFGTWPMPSYSFKNTGKYALQVDIRNPQKPAQIEQYWLGEFQVADGATSNKEELVQSVSWRPFTVSPSLKTPLEFIINKGNIPLDELEFQLWTLKDNESWKIAQDYQSWPLPAYQFKEEGIYSLQINVRRKADPENVQMLWLGQFYPHNQNRSENADYLLRRVLTNYPEPNVNELSYLHPFIYELNLAVHLLYWDYRKFSLPEQERHLRTLQGVQLKKQTAPGMYDIRINESQTRTVNLGDNLIESPFTVLKVDSKSYANVITVFQSTKHLPQDMQIAAAMTYLLYVNYLYSQVPFEKERPRPMFYSTIAHCQNYSHELNELLGILGYTVRALDLTYNSGAVHALNEVKVNGRYYMLDATTGVVYETGIQGIRTNYVSPTVLPQVRELDFIWSAVNWKGLGSFIQSASYGKW